MHLRRRRRRCTLARSTSSSIGEKKRARKFTERYIGPYRVKRVVNDNAYELELPATLKIHPVINVSQLKEHRDGTQLFPDRPVPLTRPPPEAHRRQRRAGVGRSIASSTIADMVDGKRDQYLVLWKGYPVSEATWEPIENLDGAIELVVEYNQQHKININCITEIPSQPTSRQSIVMNISSPTPSQSELTTAASRTKLSSLSMGGCNRALSVWHTPSLSTALLAFA